MASFDGLGVGISGLMAAQRALTTTSHNIANSATEGYSRQRAEFVTRPPEFIGVGYLGTGVEIDTIHRIVDDYVGKQLLGSTAAFNEFEHYFVLAGQVNNMLADPGAGLTPTLQRFFDATQDVANDPAAAPPRQVLLSEARSLTERFAFMQSQLNDFQTGTNREITSIVSEINGFSRAISDINRDIVLALGNGQPPNDLLDQRDELVRQLSERVSVSTVMQDNGALNVFVGNGQALVVGYDATPLLTTGNQYDPRRLEVGLDTGSSIIAITNQLQGGRLGGVLAFRRDIVDQAQNALGRIAIGLAINFNGQHRLGSDLYGNLGGDFFSTVDQTSPEVLASSNNLGVAPTINAHVIDGSKLTTSNYKLDYDGATYALTRLDDGAVVASLSAAAFAGGTPLIADGVELSYVGGGGELAGDSFLVRPTYKAAEEIHVLLLDASRIAASMPLRTEAGIGNSGNAVISQGVIQSTTGVPLAADITLTFDPDAGGIGVPGFVVAGGPVGPLLYDPATEYGGKSFTLTGFGDFAIEIAGAPAAGDQFTVTNNINGVADNRNALALAALQNAETLIGGANFQSAYGQLVADAGIATHEARIGRDAQKTLLDQIISRRESISGVNLDEEAANLIRFQQLYEASAQVIAASQTMFDTLIASVRR